MKKLSIFLAASTMVMGLASCSQEEDPKYKVPDASTFTINTPAFQNVVVETTGDMENAATFNLYCSQPDYGYSAICEYSAIVGLTPDITLDDVNADKDATPKAIQLTSLNPSSAEMSFKLYDLAVAMCKLYGIKDEADYAAKAPKDPSKVYFKAVCSIPGVDGSQVVSHNAVSYNKVQIAYAVPKPGWIYVCGNIGSPDGSYKMFGEDNSWVTPSAANLAEYNAHMQLLEPEIGSKCYAGQFLYYQKPAASQSENPVNPVDNYGQFRFFTALNGWSDPSVMVASAVEDFFCKDISGDFDASGLYGNKDAVAGKGNWGWFVESYEGQPVTLVVNVKTMKVWFQRGFYDVTLVKDGKGNWEPQFTASAN